MDERKMNEKNGKNISTRRDLLGAASLTAVGMAAGVAASAEAQGPNAKKKFTPLETFKFDIEAETGWNGPGGSAKEATVTQFPVSESMAGVSMRLKPGAMRELHWHAIAAEWAYMVKGNVRATVATPDGQAEQADFTEGDIWYFPKGHPHALQNLGPEDCHFILVFDDGHFSEFGTFSVTDWMALTPPNILARNLGVPVDAISTLPKSEVYICPGKIPPAMPEALLNGDPATNQFPHKYRLRKAPYHVSTPKGTIKLVTQKEFPIQTTLSAAIEELKPGAIREMHWHPNSDEWQYYLSGKARVRIFGAHGRMLTDDFVKGNVGFIKQGFGHYVENIGDEPLRFLAMFNTPHFQEVSITSWLSANPPGMLVDNLGLSRSMVDKLPKEAMPIL
jgi:oxalate decarboxylase